MTLCAGEDGLSRISEVFDFPVEFSDFRIYTFADDEGLRTHANFQSISPHVRLTFLVNAPQDVSRQVFGHFSYVFFLDEEPVEREFLPQNYQLAYADQNCNRTFQQWGETVIHSLCACFLCNSIPAFDAHDVASVLLESQQHRLFFNIVPFDTSLMPPGGQDRSIFNRLLAVVFASPEWGICQDGLDKLDRCGYLGKWVITGGAFHPYEERSVMLLGDLTGGSTSRVAIKNELLSGEVEAIY